MDQLNLSMSIEGAKQLKNIMQEVYASSNESRTPDFDRNEINIILDLVKVLEKTT